MCDIHDLLVFETLRDLQIIFHVILSHASRYTHPIANLLAIPALSILPRHIDEERIKLIEEQSEKQNVEMETLRNQIEQAMNLLEFFADRARALYFINILQQSGTAEKEVFLCFN